MQPQVDGNLTRIFVKSGDVVKAGQVLMQIDPLKQVATVQSQQGTEPQQKALYQYNQSDVARQKQLYDSGIISKQAYEQALPGIVPELEGRVRFCQRADRYAEGTAQVLRYPRAICGHCRRYSGTSRRLRFADHRSEATVDENNDLEAYIYLPTERAAAIHNGLGVDLLDNTGAVLTHSTIYFVSPEVDNGLQSVLAKAPIPASSKLRNGQLVNARVTFSTNQQPTVPVLAVVRIGGQSFVYVAAPNDGGFLAHQAAVELGEPVGNIYPVLSGLKPGDRVILSGIQFLQEGVPVQPLSPPPAAAPAS